MNRYRGTYVRVDLGAIAHNLALVRGQISPDTKVLAVVKANAYGHGSIRVSKIALSSGADMLGVAIPEEGEKLRLAGITAPILVLGGVNEQGAECSVCQGLIQTVFDSAGVYMLEHACEKLGKSVQVHIKLDTGMGRIGVRNEEELQEVLSALQGVKQVHLTGAFTHFADADGPDAQYSKEQLNRFIRLSRLLPQGILLHAAASTAMLRYPDACFQMVRAGIIMYGCPPWPGCKLFLQPALSWHAEITYVKTVHKGDFISYGCTFMAQRDMRVATLAVGYGDGYHRALSGKAQVLIHGVRCPVIGRICMDQTMVDVTQVHKAQAGDDVVLLGKQENEEISADELASWAGTISYEMLLAPSDRVPIEYLEDE